MRWRRADGGICHKRSSSVAVATCHSNDDNDDAGEARSAPSRTQDRPSGAKIRAQIHFISLSVKPACSRLFSLVASMCFRSSTVFIPSDNEGRNDRPQSAFVSAPLPQSRAEL